MLWDRIFSKKAGMSFGGLGVILLICCVFWAAILEHRGIPDVNKETCEEQLKKNKNFDKELNPKASDEIGKLRIAGMYPSDIMINRRICLAVAAKSGETRLYEALAARRREADTHGKSADQAYEAAKDAKANAAKAEGEAETAEKDGLASAPELRTKATKARTEANTKDTTATDLDKKKKAAADELISAETALSKGLPPVDLTLYLGGRRAGDMIFKAAAISGIQYVFYDLSVSPDATSSTGKFWRDLFGSGTENGVKKMGVGVSRVASDSPEATLDVNGTLEFRVYCLAALIGGGISMLLLFLAFCSLAKHTSLLRDNNKSLFELDTEFTAKLDAAREKHKEEVVQENKIKIDDTKTQTDKDNAKNLVAKAKQELDILENKRGQPGGSYSLGRTQMALWLMLTFAGFIFLWLMLGQFLNVITASVLILLGINGVTGLVAIQLDRTGDATSQSKSFWSDLLKDGDRPQLHRIQVVLWTLILGAIFLWNAVAKFTFIAFDANLLLLMGIANGI